MSGRPGYEELVAQRGRKAADEIIASAELYSDNAHQKWETALASAVEQYDRPEDPELTAQQAENVRLYEDLMDRRGDVGRRISYLANELGGDAFDHPARLIQAELIYDAEGARLGPDASMRDELDWASAQAETVRNRTTS
jgi:hypothetical protein